MKVTHGTLRVATKGHGFHDVTTDVREFVAKSGVTSGTCTVAKVTMSLVAATARGPLAVIRAASARAPASASPGAVSEFTSP